MCSPNCARRVSSRGPRRRWTSRSASSHGPQSASRGEPWHAIGRAGAGATSGACTRAPGRAALGRTGLLGSASRGHGSARGYGAAVWPTHPAPSCGVLRAARLPTNTRRTRARVKRPSSHVCPLVPSISASLLTSAVAAHCLLASSTVARPFPDNPPVGASEVFGNFGRVPGQLLACQVEPCLGASAESSPPCPAAPWFKERGAAAQAAQALLCRAELPCGPQPTPNHMAPKQSRKRKAVAKPAEEVGPGRPTPNSHKRLTPSTGSAHRSECRGSARRRCFFSGGVVSGGVGMAEIPT